MQKLWSPKPGDGNDDVSAMIFEGRQRTKLESNVTTFQHFSDVIWRRNARRLAKNAEGNAE
jgi:hypothetical protein